MAQQIPIGFVPLCQALLEGQERILRAKLFGVYVYGAIAFPEGGATADIDFHAILASPPALPEREALIALHDQLARDYMPMGVELDGHYILLEDALHTARPPHQLFPGVCDFSWALHRAHLRAGRCFVLYGPVPEHFLPAPSWAELESALQGELDYVTAHLADAPAYCVLNLCRLIYSHQTHDVVVSKRASAAWALPRFPEWRPVIEAALRSYDRQVLDEGLLPSDLAAFYALACEQIRAVAADQSPVG